MYQRFLSGEEEVTDSQSGPLREYYNLVQRLIQHPEIDNDGKHVGGSEDEARRIHAKGYRQVVGSILWLARNSAPIVSYGASILSKCKIGNFPFF